MFVLLHWRFGCDLGVIVLILRLQAIEQKLFRDTNKRLIRNSCFEMCEAITKSNFKQISQF